jgi:pyruvate dehydrogenase E1 component beta subunit
MFYHVPGLKVVMPATPADAGGLLVSAIRDEDPVIFIEHKQLYLTEGDGPVGDPVPIPLGVADVKRSGSDVTLVAWSNMVLRSLKAAEELEAEGVSVEVIDLRTLVPMDLGRVLDSVRRTGRLVIVQEAVRRGGVASDIAANIGERAFDVLRAPVVRVTGRETVIPFNLALERASVPQVADIVAGVRTCLDGSAATAARFA